MTHTHVPPGHKLKITTLVVSVTILFGVTATPGAAHPFVEDMESPAPVTAKVAGFGVGYWKAEEQGFNGAGPLSIVNNQNCFGTPCTQLRYQDNVGTFNCDFSSHRPNGFGIVIAPVFMGVENGACWFWVTEGQLPGVCNVRASFWGSGPDDVAVDVYGHGACPSNTFVDA